MGCFQMGLFGTIHKSFDEIFGILGDVFVPFYIAKRI